MRQKKDPGTPCGGRGQARRMTPLLGDGSGHPAIPPAATDFWQLPCGAILTLAGPEGHLAALDRPVAESAVHPGIRDNAGARGRLDLRCHSAYRLESGWEDD